MSALIKLVSLIVVISMAGESSRTASPGGSTVPLPPSNVASRFGVYNWNVNSTNFPNDGSTDRLNWGAGKVAETGTRTIRIALPVTDIYHVLPEGVTDLVEIARSPAFDKLLKDSRFDTILLTAYTLGDMSDNWSDGFSAVEYAAERDEFRRLGEYLLNEPAFAGKTFILLNWEGDNAILYYANKRSIWDAYVEWIRSRAEGIALAREANTSSAARIYSGLEFNTLTSFSSGQPCGTPVTDPVRGDPLGNRCVIDYVAPRVEVDYYSYSAWRSLDVKLDSPGESLKARLKSDFQTAQALVNTQRPEVRPENFILGEFGFERARYGECNAANYVSEVFDAILAPDGFNASYAIYWQVLDNAPFLGVGVEYFGLFRHRDGQFSPTLPGNAFSARLAGGQWTPIGGCPQIRRPPPFWGVLNSTGTTDFRLNPDSVISIYVPNCCDSAETPFSAAGNTVHFDQTASHFELPRDNGLFFYESPTQINFSMAPGRRPGAARVYVTDARGIESNAQEIVIGCEECPAVDNPFGLLDATFQTLQLEPGSPVAVTGKRFAASGNRIVIEQIDGVHVRKIWSIDSALINNQSTERIEFNLPHDLEPGLNAALRVVGSSGLESNDLIFTVSGDCAPCGPRLKPYQAINTTSGFVPGAPVTITGRFDKTSGLRAVIEQTDSGNRFYRHLIADGLPGWSASSTQIGFDLPFDLFPGRAIIYAIDSDGRESRAQNVMISSGAVTAVSAANYGGAIIAADSISAIFGSPLAPGTESATTIPLPTALLGAGAFIEDSLGTSVAVPLFFVSPRQINFHVPPALASGPARLRVINGYGSESIGDIFLGTVSPGLFTANADGKGVAAGFALRVIADGTQVILPIAAFNPLTGRFDPVPIETGTGRLFLVLFGTGIRSAGNTTTATIGGLTAEILYSGPQPEFVGLDQINLELPSGLTPSGEVEIILTAAGIEANRVVVSLK